MNKNTFFVEFDDEIQRLLADNELSVREILQRADIDAEVTQGLAPYKSPDSKELTTIILASGVSALLISAGIAKVLNAIFNRTRVVEFSDIVEVRDASGNIAKDKKGRPMFKKVKRLVIVNPHEHPTSNKLEASFGTDGVALKFSDSEGASE